MQSRAGTGLKGLKKKRRIQIVALAFAALTLSVGLVAYAMQDGINFFRSPVEVLAEAPPETETFRLGGLVKPGSIVNREGVQFDFVVTDGGAEIPVRYIGRDPRPDLFKENTGTIATGRLIAGTFEATTLLAKHDETYMPKEVMDALKAQGVYQQPDS
ncbi:cytochrome c maturation protein CcmE [Pseudogemmobacter faecipullorum]|uniref:Cytochrome c-type biogenesis protein CcmE n=1 Tax=Pseudogemmobacter faecipullorum TaxID=2755041 RepID=A0ABS8CIR2_9RHOB|nr:cytochrome c maturation protein CcmE [Pseudogemmobacter faecipullorum]MCB5409293.1 cytochrome c maturation protein CcmE [Pseudogemmobacter faecipullorum]